MDNAQNDIDVNDRDAVLKEVKRICDSYAHNVEELNHTAAEIKRLEALKETYTEDGYRAMIDDGIRGLQAKSEQCLKDVLFFDRALTKCDGKTATIIRQIYVDEISWDFIRDIKGRPISRGTISNARNKALELFADEYCKDELF